MKRIVSLILALAITLGNSVFAFFEESEPLKGDGNGSFDVTMIVELDGGGVLERTRAMGGTSFFADNEKMAVREVSSTQESVGDALNNKFGCETTGTLDYVTNALIVQGKNEDVEKIEAIDGVKAVYVSKTRSIIEPFKAAEVMELGAGNLRGYEQTHTVALDKVSDTYKGEGMVIGIIDSEFQYDHEAFVVAPANPRISADKVDEILSGGTLKAEELVKCELTSADVYKSEKVPFVFDYANKDTEPKTNNTANYHGTHVAGIAAAKSNNFSGIAPEAQIIFAKVCMDGAKTMDDVTVCKALDDFAVFKPDIINMSLGSDAGFSEDITTLYGSMFATLEREGIRVAAAAGNSGRQGDKVGAFAPYTTMPDYGLVASPSTVPYAISVASLSTDHSGTSIYSFTLADGTALEYYDCSQAYTTERIREVINGENVEYVDCGLGREAEFQAVGNLKGKLALVARGGDSFQNIFTRAEDSEAMGIILLNTAETYFEPVVSGCTIPAAVVKLSGTEILKNATTKTLTAKPGAYTISSFSSRGVTPDLKLKPEVTAVGQWVYSAGYDNSYKYMSGTSMATPQYAGAHLLALDYINKAINPSMPDEQKDTLAYQLLASSATIWTVDGDLEKGIPDTPRAQGAGVINLEKMTETPCIVVNDYDDKVKVELGEIKSNTLSVKFKVKNLFSSPVTYSLVADVICDGYKDVLVGDETVKVVDKMRRLSANVSFDTSNTLTIPGNDERTVTMTAVLDESELLEIGEVFPNGFFIDGFIRLVNEDVPEISIPFTGFYGDWNALSVFGGEEYGLNNIACRIAVTPSSISGASMLEDSEGVLYYSPNLGLLGVALQPSRNIKTLNINIYDSQNNLVYSGASKNIPKKQNGDFVSFHGAFKGLTQNGKLPDGRLRMDVLAYPDAANATPQTLSYEVYMDSTYPQVDNIVLANRAVNGVQSRWLAVDATDVSDDLWVAGLQAENGTTSYFNLVSAAGTQFFNSAGFVLPSYNLVVMDIAMNTVSLPIVSHKAYVGHYEDSKFKNLETLDVLLSGGFIMNRFDVVPPDAGEKKIFVWGDKLEPVVPAYTVR